MKKKHLWWVMAGLAAFAAAAWGPIVSNVEQAKYNVVESYGSIEIRDYAPMIVAETMVEGERKIAINQGFRMIADYIFGNNAPTQEVAMTAPVIQEKAGSNWKVRFVMPASYTMETLPKPNNNSVKLTAVSAKRFAVIRFSGTGSAENLMKREDELAAFIKEKRLKALPGTTYAFYNPPWTLPFLRRNEVLSEISK